MVRLEREAATSFEKSRNDGSEFSHVMQIIAASRVLNTRVRHTLSSARSDKRQLEKLERRSPELEFPPDSPPPPSTSSFCSRQAEQGDESVGTIFDRETIIFKICNLELELRCCQLFRACPESILRTVSPMVERMNIDEYQNGTSGVTMIRRMIP